MKMGLAWIISSKTIRYKGFIKLWENIVFDTDLNSNLLILLNAINSPIGNKV